MTASFAARIAISNFAIVIRGDWTGTRYNPAQPKRERAITNLQSVGNSTRSLGQSCSSGVRRDVQESTGWSARLNPVHVTPTMSAALVKCSKQASRSFCISLERVLRFVAHVRNINRRRPQNHGKFTHKHGGPANV